MGCFRWHQALSSAQCLALVSALATASHTHVKRSACAAAHLATKALRPARKHERTALRAAPVTRPDLDLALHCHQRPPRRWGVITTAVALSAARKVVAAAAGTLPVARTRAHLLAAREASLAPEPALTTLAPEARLLPRSRAPWRRINRLARALGHRVLDALRVPVCEVAPAGKPAGLRPAEGSQVSRMSRRGSTKRQGERRSAAPPLRKRTHGERHGPCKSHLARFRSVRGSAEACALCALCAGTVPCVKSATDDAVVVQILLLSVQFASPFAPSPPSAALCQAGGAHATL